MFRKFYPLIALLLFLTACQGQEVQVTTVTSEKEDDMSEVSNDVDETLAEATENEESTESVLTIFDGFKLLLTAESTAADLGQYITAHIEEVSSEEAEEMIQWLMIYQTELYQDYLYNSYESPYADALNLTLGGILDPTKVQDIEDELIRADYQNMVDGLMTIVRYEESPIAETNWSAIAAYNHLFSDDFAYLVDLRDMYATTYDRQTYDVAEDIVTLEAMIHQTSNPFHLSQLTNFYQDLVSDLLIGPEGYYIGTFVGKSDAHYRTLMSFAGDYSQSDFGQLILQLDAGTWADYRGPLDIYDDFIAFSPISDFYWTRTTINDANVEFNLRSLNSDTKPAIAKSVNDSILSTLDALSEETNGSYAGNMHVFYSDDVYITAFLSLHYLKTPEQTAYIEQAITIDLTTGKTIDISDLFSMTPEEALSTVNHLTDSDFTEMPYLEFTYSGIALRAPKSDASVTKYAQLSLKDLVPYLNIEQLSR